MMNQFWGVGRLVAEPEKKTSENGKSYLNFTVAVPRSYKNADGEYETDFIDVVTFGPMAETTSEYCKKGDLIGIKGRVETSVYENEAGEKKKSTQIIADRISFLSSAKIKEDENVKVSDGDLDM
ncbi:MAG: single-stranded DNA-binding protein [bacterium]|nr:single-stranded DNA-binding protein [bacterium]